MIYLDNAATSGKKPLNVINAVKYSLYNLSANPGRSGHTLSAEASEAVFSARETVSKYFNSFDLSGVIFTLNCTQAINTVLKGTLERGDNVLISDMEHNAVMRPLTAMKTDYTAVNVSLNNDDETVLNFENAIKENTKMIFVSSASNVLGKTLPLKKLGELSKKHGLLFGVDAAQGAGLIPIDMKEMNIDFLCIASHKGLYAPMGTGILIANKPIQTTIIEGGTGSESINLNQPKNLPERFESGTVNLPGIIGIKEGIKFIEKRKSMYNDEMRLLQNLYEFLDKEQNVILYTPYPENEKYVPVLSFNIKGLDSQTVSALLDKNGICTRAGLHCAPTAHGKIGTLDTGTVRLSPGYFNTPNDIYYTEKIIKKISENYKKYVD